MEFENKQSGLAHFDFFSFSDSTEIFALRSKRVFFTINEISRTERNITSNFKVFYLATNMIINKISDVLASN